MSSSSDTADGTSMRLIRSLKRINTSSVFESHFNGLASVGVIVAVAAVAVVVVVVVVGFFITCRRSLNK